MAKKRVRRPSAADVKKRADQSYENKDRGNWRSILRPDVDEIVGFELPTYRPDKGDHIIDFLSWQAGPQDPATEEGTWTHLVDLWVHTRVGPNNDNFVCLAKNYGKPCGICEERDALREEGASDDEVKALLPKRQSVFLIWDRKNENEGVQIWAGISHHFVEKLVQNIAKDPKTGEKIYYMAADAENGRSVAFHVGTKNVPGIGAVPDYGGYQFVPRDEDIPEWVYEQVETIGPVDLLLDIPTYEDTLRAVGQTPVGPHEGEDDMSEEERHDPRSIGRVAPAEPEDDDDEDLPDGWDSSSVDEGEEKPPEEECPYGGVFGEDFDKYEECDSCDPALRKACSGEEEEEEEEEPPEEEPPKPTPRPKRKPSPRPKKDGGGRTPSRRKPSPRKRK